MVGRGLAGRITVSRRTVGFSVAAVGAVMIFVFAAADVIGVGSADMFGNRQIIGTALGALVVAAGLVVALLPARPVRRESKGAGGKARSRPAGDRPAPPVKRPRRR
jgi:hypothetical protein